jgi:PAS domain S-box-containing protein
LNYDLPSWVMTIYITIAGVCACFLSSRALFFFSVYLVGLGLYLAHVNHYRYDFFVPGLITITALMNITLYYRNRALKQVAEGKIRFEKLFNATFEAVALHENGKIIAVNKSFGELFGVDSEEVIGQEIFSFVAPESLDVVVQQTDEGWERPYEIDTRTRTGERIPVQVSVKRHIYEGREVRMVAVRDLRDRLRFEAERRKKLEAQAAVELRDQFISIASHELRTPLTPLKLSNDILVRLIEERGLDGLTSAHVLRILRNTGTQIGRITKLIDDMLDVSRMKIGHFELNLEDFDFNEMVRQVADLYAYELERSGTSLRVIAKKQPIPVHLDRNRVEQVLTNFVKNALIYGNGKPIVITYRCLKDRVFFSVRDRGIGIPEDKIGKIFERFERAVSAKNYGGLGLGLYIVQQIVSAHRGEVRVKSKLGRGSRFSAIFPLRAKPGKISFRSENHSNELELE